MCQQDPRHIFYVPGQRHGEWGRLTSEGKEEGGGRPSWLISSECRDEAGRRRKINSLVVMEPTNKDLTGMLVSRAEAMMKRKRLEDIRRYKCPEAPRGRAVTNKIWHDATSESRSEDKCEVKCSDVTWEEAHELDNCLQKRRLPFHRINVSLPQHKYYIKVENKSIIEMECWAKL